MIDEKELLIPVDPPKYKGRPRADGLPPGSPEAKAADAAKGKGAPRKPRGSKLPDTVLRDKLIETYTMLGMGLMLSPKYQGTAQTIAQNAEQCADAWIETCKHNPRLRKVLERLMSGMSGAGLLMAHMPILLVAATETGLLKGTMADMAKQMSHAT